MGNYIEIKGARVHNLKNINVKIPRDKLVVITGLSGSGKSSLAFDTIFAEGQRRFVESLSAFARQFLGMMEKPDVDSITGLSPAISIDQKVSHRNPRSTVGTVTEINDYLRLLFAKAGRVHCPDCGKLVQKQTASEIVDLIAEYAEGKKIILLAPLVEGKKGEHLKILENIRKSGFVRMRVDGEIVSVNEEIELDSKKKHSVDIVIDRLVVKNFKKVFKELSTGEKFEDKNPERSRLADSVELTLKHGKGKLIILDAETGEQEVLSENFACVEHGNVISELEPRNFSFNSPYGACQSCHGLGSKLVVKEELVMPNPRLSLDEGAILPWANMLSRESWNYRILKAVAKKYSFAMDTKVADLTKKQREIILYGTGDDEYAVKMDSDKFSGDFMTRYEGVIPNLERRYKETDSDFARKQIEKFMEEEICTSCQGARLRREVLNIRVADVNIIDISKMSIEKLFKFFDKLPKQLNERENEIAKLIIQEVKSRLSFLMQVGLGFLTLNRSASTLSGGEAQRIRLATQIGSNLQGVLFVLDEPSIGLHQRDNEKLIKTIRDLQKLGNTVIVVEHDEEMMREADYLLEIGPGAGKYGGNVMAEGIPEDLIANEKSITGQYLKGTRKIEVPDIRRTPNGNFLEIINAHEHNLKNLNVKIPLGVFVGVTGVSGSGKSTLINEILAPSLTEKLNRASAKSGAHDEIRGIEHLDKAIVIDQSPIGRTPRSNPATFTGVFTEIRDLFSNSPEAKLRGYKPGRFSFNVKGGRCEQCMGDGMTKIEMHFLPDIFVPCETCKGKRFNAETLEITWRGKNIADVLAMTVQEALEFFDKVPKIREKLDTLNKVGLGYVHLGQSATTLSGGEAQRIKLATELSKRSTGNTIYILDEPTTGLHFQDIEKLLVVLNALVDNGNTVVVIEHNLDVIKNCDHLLDLGPDGGDGGGLIVAEGTPEEVAKVGGSYTGQFLKDILS
ncbi:MAG: excinuclease ABC subunit UvrA [Candidatus Gracilibacteria bacterium]|jgi:excinuclease ABC subunit A|nr:excinuclease ABC subunit UvrA [Candidatus Gracilibacteria bacterium]